MMSTWGIPVTEVLTDPVGSISVVFEFACLFTQLLFSMSSNIFIHADFFPTYVFFPLDKSPEERGHAHTHTHTR